MDYPFPILDWTQADAYPPAGALDLDGWAWEFLRRNPEYQRLFDWFATLPDFVTLPDGSTSTKNGKCRGTPWRDFAFFEGGACWYADPPPIPGELRDAYEARTGGEVMPFADYLCRRFKVGPYPRDPRLAYDLPDALEFGFCDVSGTEVAPFYLNVADLLESLDYAPPHVASDIRERHRNPSLVTFTFDLRKSLDRQLDDVKSSLQDERGRLAADFEPTRKPKAQFREFPVYVRLLDAAAAGATVADMAAEFYRGERNTRADGFRVSTKVRQNLAAAKRLRDGGYWDMLA